MAEQQSFITADFICELCGVCLQGTEMGQAKDLLVLVARVVLLPGDVPTPGAQTGRDRGRMDQNCVGP